MNTLIIHDGLADTYLQGVRDYESLPDGDRLRVALIFQKTVRLMEQQLIHIQKSGVDDSYFVSTNLGFEEFFTFPGVQIWWETSKQHFEESLRARVDQLIAQGKERGYKSTFAKKSDGSST